MWSNKGKGEHENHTQNNSCLRTTAWTSTASFSQSKCLWHALTSKCLIYLSQLFSPEIPFCLGSQLERVCVCGEGHNSRAGLLSREDSLARLECRNTHSRALKEMKLASFSLFFCPAQLLCQPSRCPTFPEENVCIRTHCPKSSRVLTAKASPELALVTIQEIFHVEPNSCLFFGKPATAKSALLTIKSLTANPLPPGSRGGCFLACSTCRMYCI